MAAQSKNQRGSPLAPPKASKDGRQRVQALGKGKGQKQSDSKHPDTEAHAREVREVVRGRDIVEKKPVLGERRPAPFDRKELMVVRNWLRDRPLEPAPNATALVQYPRLWATKRGRYCKFQAPGAGVYGLLRARPTF